MIPVGTRVIVHWDYYEYENNIELVYNGNDTFHGVVIEFDDNNAEDRIMKNYGGFLKVKIDEKGKMPDDICYPEEKHIEIEGAKLTEEEVIKRNASIGWIRCTEENYPESENTIIADWWENENTWKYYRWAECPFGWNVLCRLEAYWKKIDAPIRNKED